MLFYILETPTLKNKIIIMYLRMPMSSKHTRHIFSTCYHRIEPQAKQLNQSLC